MRIDTFNGHTRKWESWLDVTSVRIVLESGQTVHLREPTPKSRGLSVQVDGRLILEPRAANSAVIRQEDY